MNETLLRFNIRNEFNSLTDSLDEQTTNLNKLHGELEKILKRRRYLINANTIKQDNENLQQQLSMALDYDLKLSEYNDFLRIYELGIQTCLTLLHTAVEHYVVDKSIQFKVLINNMIGRLAETIGKLDHRVTLSMSTIYLLPDYIKARCADQFKLRPLATMLSRLITMI